MNCQEFVVFMAGFFGQARTHLQMSVSPPSSEGGEAPPPEIVPASDADVLAELVVKEIVPWAAVRKVQADLDAAAAAAASAAAASPEEET